MIDAIDSIRKLTSLDTVKSKRSYRRGKITRFRARNEELQRQPLRDLESQNLLNIKEDLQQELHLHNVLQSQYETLFSDKAATEEEMEAEEHAADELKSQHKLIQRSLNTLIKKLNLYFEAISIKGDIAHLEKFTTINTHVFEKAFGKFNTRVTFLQDTLGFQMDDEVRVLRESFEGTAPWITTMPN